MTPPSGAELAVRQAVRQAEARQVLARRTSPGCVPDLTLWLHDPHHNVTHFHEELRERITGEQRRAVLRIKDAWHRRPEYPGQVGGSTSTPRCSRTGCGPRASSPPGWPGGSRPADDRATARHPPSAFPRYPTLGS